MLHILLINLNIINSSTFAPDQSKMQLLNPILYSNKNPLSIQFFTYSQSKIMKLLLMVEGEGFEPSKAEPTDLQSVPFGRSGTPPTGKVGILG